MYKYVDKKNCNVRCMCKQHVYVNRFFYINVWNCEIKRTPHHLLEKKDIPFQNWIVPSPEQVVRETHIQLYRNACKARSCILAL